LDFTEARYSESAAAWYGDRDIAAIFEAFPTP
jgi:hypothetical protein